MLEHGGRLRDAARRYDIALERWLDLSTGISPFVWPLPDVPAVVWQRLPEEEDGLDDAARDYYRTRSVLPVAGTQAAIQALPRLRSACRVGVIVPGYAEHAQAWRRAGHTVETRRAEALIEHASRYDVVVLIHPNNPGGERFDAASLLQVHERLAARGGWLIVDEAFIDATPECSLCADSHREGLIVLRSAGKFFGLAGARGGFVCAAPALLDSLREQLGPWTLSGPTRYVLRQALLDRTWHDAARKRLIETSGRLAGLLERHGLAPNAGCAFFQWRIDERAQSLHGALAERGILTRSFETPASLRFGLPGDETSFRRLEEALHEVMHR